jgi:hypothetical protein
MIRIDRNSFKEQWNFSALKSLFEKPTPENQVLSNGKKHLIIICRVFIEYQ